MKSKSPKFRVGQIIMLRPQPGDGNPIYLPHKICSFDGVFYHLIGFPDLIFRDNELRPLNAKEIGPRRKKSKRPDEEKRKLYAGERLYSAAEVALERAALLREVGERLDYCISCYDDDEGAQRIALRLARDKVLAIPTDQSALARVEAAAYERAKLVCGDWFLNWCNRVGVKVEESNIRQGIAALQDRGREADNDQ